MIQNNRNVQYERFKQKYGIQLNRQQDLAVQSVEGAVLLLAVPGSGKTTVLVARIGYMIYVEQIQPRNILTVTYTVAATNDMKSRFCSLFGEEYIEELEFRTINGICQKILGFYGRIVGKKLFELVDSEANNIIKMLYSEFNHGFATENDIRNISTAISYVKNMRLQASEIEKMEVDVKKFPEIYREYNAQLRQRGLIDYDDQMVYALKILESCPEILAYFQDLYQYICVDEAQDTSKIQHDIINLLASKHNHLFMVGDEDQSIYGFRAAYPQGLLDFEKRYKDAKVLLMESNYRSCGVIVEKADLFIQKNQYRHFKSMKKTREEEGRAQKIQVKERKNQYNYLLEVAKKCQHTTAILYRNNESALPMIDLLERNHLPFRMKGTDMVFFSHPVVTDLMEILCFALQPTDCESFMRIYYKIGVPIRKEYALQMVANYQGEESILKMADELDEIPFYVKKSCRKTIRSLHRIASETAGRAVHQILNILKYRDYIEEHNMDVEKAEILQLLADKCDTVYGFIARLKELKEMIGTGVSAFDANLTLSTIHSSKGLEYDRVYLIDMMNGILPLEGKIRFDATEAERMLYEEERRLFYVAMTRAKDEMYIFTFTNGITSCFSEEVFQIQENKETLERKVNVSGTVSYRIADTCSPEEVSSRMHKIQPNVIVKHRLYGRGIVKEREDKAIVVLFDNGKQMRMVLEYVVVKGIITLVE